MTRNRIGSDVLWRSTTLAPSHCSHLGGSLLGAIYSSNTKFQPPRIVNYKASPCHMVTVLEGNTSEVYHLIQGSNDLMTAFPGLRGCVGAAQWRQRVPDIPLWSERQNDLGCGSKTRPNKPSGTQDWYLSRVFATRQFGWYPLICI